NVARSYPGDLGAYISFSRGGLTATTADTPQNKVDGCQEGFYRTTFGKCSPCNCNGNANRCLDGSGICVGCQRNTTGEHCDQCPDGFIGDVVRGVPTFCQPCPCPLPGTANFADSCYRKNGSVRCVCKENYAGPNCERCAPGYYGNPLLIGSTCKKCDCSGNSDPNLIFEDCDEVTGQCRNCLRNTTGFNCERCAPGYYGDARFAKNCTECNCGGRMCDSQTGECLADSPVVSTGTDCPTISCDKCIWDLTDDIQLAVLAIDESKTTLLSISTGVAAQKRLNDLNLTATYLQVQTVVMFHFFNLISLYEFPLHLLKFQFLPSLKKLSSWGNQASSKGLLIQKETTKTNNRATQLIQQLHNMKDNIQEISSKMKYYAIQQELSPEEIAQKLSVAEEMLKEIKRRKPFTNHRQLAAEEEDAAEDLLQRVEEFHERYNDTRSLVSDVKEQFHEYDMKLSDLEETVNQAFDYVIQTEDMNQENTANLQEHEKQHEKIKEQVDEVNGILLSATTTLAGPQKINSELSEVIKNVSGFYAEIDGAKKELQEKIANLSLFDDDLVEKAMHHAHNLRGLADELDRNLHGVDTNGLVQRAINASNVYENIASYIEEANKAALLALNTTNRVNDAAVGIDTQVIYHKGKSEELLNRAMQLQQTADYSNDLTVADTSRHVNGTLARMNALRGQLMRAITKMQSAEPGLEARQRLEQAKQKTAQAESTTTTVNQATTPMDENVRLWSQNMQDFQHSSAAYKSAVHSAGDAVRKLEEVFPQLLNKLHTVEQKAPANNISSSIRRIRELIAQTRSVASKVQVSMTFGGQSAVEVNPKINVEELKSFTSMSLYIKLQKDNPQLAASPDRFILYLGSKNVKNYMGLAIKNDNLVYIYNLGGQDVEIPLDSKPVSTWPSYFSIIKIESMFFSLEMHNGFLYLRYDFGFSTGPMLLEDSMKKAQINDAKFHEISIIYHNSKKMILVVDRRHIKSVDNERTAMPFTDIYIGGAPAEILQSSISSHLAGSIGFKGCMKGFQFQKKDFNLLEEPGTLGISYGCPEDSLMSRKAYFNGESFIASSQKVSLLSEFEGGFNFRTLQPNGLLFYYSEGSDVLSISMDRGAVVLNASGIKIQSPDRNYNDGKTHFIITSVTPERYELSVDDKKQSKKNPAKDRAGKSPDSIKKFYFGGSPLKTQQANFTGCISNAYFTRCVEVEVEDFQRYSEKVQTSFYGCPVESPPVALLHKKGKNSSKAKGNRNKKVGRDKDKISQPSTGLKKMYQEVNMQKDPQCQLPMNPKATENAYQFGGTANSRQEFDHIPKDLTQFSISLKTLSSHGMIFYVSDQKETNFMALFVAHGRLIFMFNAGHQKIRIKSQEKYNDGLWHNVIFIRGKNIGRLIIDGLRVLEEPFSGNTNTWQVTEPLYIGGVAPGKAVKNIQINSVYSFSGCLSNLQLNGRSITSASQTFSVTPCFEGPSEAGTYFSSEGGYVVLDESFSLGLKFEVVFEIRPRSSSGILLHGHSVNGEYLNMHMRNGQVTVKLNNGIRDFSTSVTLKQSLCDGRWHRIAVIRDANVVQLDVDSEVNHVVGPLNPKAIDHREPVFIGGVPESLLTSSLTTRNSFIGCIRNFMIDEKPVSFSKAALVSGAVSINSCPAA
uniref:Laminin subunit alpha-4 n=1 Tax=Anas platyrhynchos platyrhynchos TaxID=8840 RepID=U3J2Y1_ANAPP